VALVLAARAPDREGAAVVVRLLEELRAAGVEPGEAEILAALAPGDAHELPPHAEAALRAVLSSSDVDVPA